MNFIERISYKQLFSLALIVGVLITLPLTVILVQNETRMFSKAAYQNPSPIPLKQGSIPDKSPMIDTIKPFVGKEGDILVIKGVNFGLYPPGAYLQIGNLKVPENQIVSWSDQQISFYLPPGAQSATISINNGYGNFTWPRIITIYDLNTVIKVVRNSNQLLISNGDNLSRVVYYDATGNRFEEKLPKIVNYSPQQQPVWLTLFNSQNQVIPFSVDPENFNF